MCQVLVVGGGPVGMTMASELARYGISARIVDKAPARTDKSKALVLWSRTLELLDDGPGGANAFISAGLVTRTIRIFNAAEPMARLDLDSVASPFPFALMLPQSETERLLETRLAGQGIRVERNVEVTAIDGSAAGVTAVLSHADGSQETVQADWLIGCDGAHSLVRHSVGAQFEGETLASDWVLGDVHLTGYRHGSDIEVHWHREGVLIVFPIGSDRFRVIADCPMAATAQAPVPDMAEIQSLIDRRGAAGLTAHDPVWLAGFRINDRKVSAYRHGRIFLAGDAAHIHSPAGGQGMNTGMQDAINLAWKLAMVAHGTGADALLDSYTPERSAVGDRVLAEAGRLTKVATLRNPLVQDIRNWAFHTILGFAAARHAAANTASELAVHYPHSPLNGPTAPGGLKAGDRVPPVPGKARTDRPVFTLCAEAGIATDIIAAHPDLVATAALPPLPGAALSLVRPDGYLAASGDDPAVVLRYLDAVRTLGRAG